MRIFLAGASGVIGVRLLALLVQAGHEVAGMTRSPGKLAELEALGAVPVLCDVYDGDGLREGMLGFGPDAVMHQLTDLPDDVAFPSRRLRGLRLRSAHFETTPPARQAISGCLWLMNREFRKVRVIWQVESLDSFQAAH
jgi:hypothetical protein